MTEPQNPKSPGFHGLALIGAAIGAVAVGAFAIGVLSVRRLAIRRLVIDGAQIKSIEINDLSVKRLHAVEATVSRSLKLPEDDGDHLTASSSGGA